VQREKGEVQVERGEVPIERGEVPRERGEVQRMATAPRRFEYHEESRGRGEQLSQPGGKGEVVDYAQLRPGTAGGQEPGLSVGPVLQILRREHGLQQGQHQHQDQRQDHSRSGQEQKYQQSQEQEARRREVAPPGPRPAPLGEDSPPVGSVGSTVGGVLEVSTWSEEVEEAKPLVGGPKRVGSGRVLSEQHVREREAGRGAAVEEARTLMEKMRVEEKQLQQTWRRERGYEEEVVRQVVEAGPRYGHRRMEGAGGREETPWTPQPAKAAGRPSSQLTLDRFLPADGARQVRGRGGRRAGGQEQPAPGAAAVGAERKVQVVSRPEAPACRAACYWRSQDGSGGGGVSCGRPCGLPLSPSCSHTCTRTCHASPCLPPSTPCPTPCPTLRPCGHACSAPCHAPGPCPALPCQVHMRIPCHCGRRSALLPCLAAASTAAATTEGQAGRGRRLECQEECFVLLETTEKEVAKVVIGHVEESTKQKKKKKKKGNVRIGGPLTAPGGYQPRTK